MQLTVCLVLDMFVGKDNDVIPEDDERVAELFSPTLAFLKTLVGEDVRLRPKAQE